LRMESSGAELGLPLSAIAGSVVVAIGIVFVLLAFGRQVSATPQHLSH
jgi:hypothetical protein